MTAPPSIDRQTFLAHLKKSGLVDAAQFDAISSRYPDVTRGKVMARKLVEEGLLTRYQAERLLAGQTTGFFLGQYRILEQIGKGGMGRVFKAEHRAMRRVVALKLLTGTMLKTDRAVQMFLHEVRAVAVLQHPNIVSAYDANTDAGRYYLVLEYVDGPNLDELVRREGPLPVGLACDYIRQAAHGLQFAHQLKMVHRDVKPANILVQRHGQAGVGTPGLIKISDFGLARLAQPALCHPGMEAAPETLYARENSVMGTPDYLSPEQSRDLHQTDIRSDLYSLGCTFYYLLTGQPPFPGGSALEKLIRHATEPPAPVASFRDDVPDGVVAILERLMAKRPDDRFQTPAELAIALAPYAVMGIAPCSKVYERLDGDEAGLGKSDEVPVVGTESPSPNSESDLAALSSTVASGMTDPDTPASLVSLRPRSRQEQRRVGLAVAVAVALATGALALLALIGLLAGGR